MQSVVTHDGEFHADDVFGVALLQLHYGAGNVRIIRTRDDTLITQGDWVLDVGGIYDPSHKRFDHHQNDAPVRENGIPYAAFGLVWKHLGEQLSGSAEVAALIESSLVMPIDAADNGILLCALTHSPLKPVEIHDIIMTYRLPWNTDGDMNVQFLRATEFAREILTRTIAHTHAMIELRDLAQSTYKNTDDVRILTFEVPISVDPLIDYPDVQLVVYPQSSQTTTHWVAQAVRTDHGSFTPRVRFPAAWAGLRDNELIHASGISDAIFSHRGRFYFVAGSREGALSAAAQAS